MGDRFDQLAKDAGGELSRRQAFWRIGGGLLAAAVASLGLTRADNACVAKTCVACCNSNIPPGSPEHGQCFQDCHQGVKESLCGWVQEYCSQG